MSPLAKRITLGVAIIVLSLQLARPVRNQSSAAPTDQHLTKLHPTPPAVQAILERACYDCHSDRTRYPWYANVQPVGWWLAYHIRDGKRHLNFSRFGGYSPDRAAHKIEGLIEEVQARTMPLPSYTWLHREAKLTDAEIQTLVDWAKSVGAKLPPP